MKNIKIGLLGNPNCGKSTLFNALTGSTQRVGNWPGVTVDRKSGYFQVRDYAVEVVDLPGVYTLTAVSENLAVDTRIACEAILFGEFDLIINIIDTSNLERNLYLTVQLLEMGIPTVIAANMQDVALKQHIALDLLQLAECLNCPVLSIAAKKKSTLTPFKHALLDFYEQNAAQQSANVTVYTPELTAAMHKIAEKIIKTTSKHAKLANYLALAALEGDAFARQFVTADIQALVAQQQAVLKQTCQEDADILIADARYTYVHAISQRVIKKDRLTQSTLTQRIDKIVLHRLLGIPLFLAAMYAMFFFSINIGGAFQPFFDQASSAIFIQGFSQILHAAHLPLALITILAAGAGGAVNTIVTFIPVIAGLFLFLSFLEASGYMARAAFVVDRCMRAVGLPGKAFVPLIVGFGCNVPAILAVRTLEHRRDRLLTLMMTPFMSCSARMAIYAVFTAAFFPHGGQNIVFGLYLVGILMAILTGLFLRKTVLNGDSSPWIMELPAYHRPTLSALLRQTWQRLRGFLFKAGKLIFPVCILVSVLNAVTINGKMNENSGAPDSILAVASQAMTPIFAPMGIHQDNWPATVGLVSGILAKEVVVGTLNTLYAQLGHVQAAADADVSVITQLKQAVFSIPTQLAGLKNSLNNPLAGNAGDDAAVAPTVLGVMYQHFDGQIGAIAYLLFALLYFPCISATAAMVRESSAGWAGFSVLWTTGLAYIVAVGFYQTATFLRHPLTSTVWIVSLATILVLTLGFIKWYARGNNPSIKPRDLNNAPI